MGRQLRQLGKSRKKARFRSCRYHLHLTQPASRSIQRLERELGTELFTGRRTTSPFNGSWQATRASRSHRLASLRVLRRDLAALVEAPADG